MSIALSMLPRLRRWLPAFAFAAFAVALQWLVQPGVGARMPDLFFQPAIVAAAAYGGRGAGLCVMLVGAVRQLHALSPDAHSWHGDADDALALAIYLAFGTLLAQLGGRLRQSSARAAAAEQRLLLAAQDTGVGIFDVDLQAGTVSMSPGLAALVGLPATGPLPVSELVARLPPGLVSESRATLARKLRERTRAYEREVQLTAHDGQPRWLMLRVHLAWSGGRAVGLRGACVDITERKAIDDLLDRTQASLAQRMADLNRLHELSSQLLESTALAQQLALILAALAEFHGARHGMIALFDDRADGLAVVAESGLDRATALRLARVLAEEHRRAAPEHPGTRLALADIEAGGLAAELRALAREHGFRAVHGTPLIGQRGDTLGLVAIVLDTPRAPTERECTLADICARKAAIIVERARAQAALEESQGRFQAVLDSSAVPFVVLDPVRTHAGAPIVDFEWTYVNDAAARALRREGESFLGRRVQEVLPGRWLASASFPHYVAVVEQCVTREFETQVDVEGADRWFHCVASPMRGAVALWFSDVSTRKQGEQALQDADRRKDEFLATLAHELRNPLAPIRQAAAISRLAHATEAQKRWSHDVIDRQVRHMALLLDDLLDVSRITRGVLPLRRAPNALADMLEAAVETARPLIDARGHALALALPPAPVTMLADALRVAQMVANLLTNAAKYTQPGGHIRLEARLDGDEVLIVVADDGIGIAAGALRSVFDMFTQLRSSGSDGGVGVGEGLGIGLALTKGLAELHGGSIAVRSEGLGRGSEFSLRLPLGIAPPRQGVPEPAGTAAACAPAPAAAARRVLVADDNRDAAESLATLLELEGHAVILAYDGEDALVAWERERPDICLLDIGMPRRSGIEVAAAIRARPGGELATLVAITGWGQESDRYRALEAGFDRHLTKPVDPAQLLQFLAQATPRGLATAQMQ